MLGRNGACSEKTYPVLRKKRLAMFSSVLSFPLLPVSLMFAAPLADPRWMSFAAPIGTAIAIMLAIDVWKEKLKSELVFLRAPVMVRWSVYSMILFSLLSVGFRPTSFIYFQF